MSDFRDFYLDGDKCPECGTAAIYKLPDGGWACKCSYEFETQPSVDEIVATVKQVRKEMAEERARGEQK